MLIQQIVHAVTLQNAEIVKSIHQILAKQKLVQDPPMRIVRHRGVPSKTARRPGRPVAHQTPHGIIETAAWSVPILPVGLLCETFGHQGVETDHACHPLIIGVHVEISNDSSVSVGSNIFRLLNFPDYLHSSTELIRIRYPARLRWQMNPRK